MASATYPAERYIPKVGEVCELLSCRNIHSQWHKITVLYIDPEVTVYQIDSYAYSCNQPTQALDFRKIQSEEEKFKELYAMICHGRGWNCDSLHDQATLLFKKGFRYIGETK